EGRFSVRRHDHFVRDVACAFGNLAHLAIGLGIDDLDESLDLTCTSCRCGRSRGDQKQTLWRSSDDRVCTTEKQNTEHARGLCDIDAPHGNTSLRATAAKG